MLAGDKGIYLDQRINGIVQYSTIYRMYVEVAAGHRRRRSKALFSTIELEYKRSLDRPSKLAPLNYYITTWWRLSLSSRPSSTTFFFFLTQSRSIAGPRTEQDRLSQPPLSLTLSLTHSLSLSLSLAFLSFPCRCSSVCLCLNQSINKRMTLIKATCPFPADLLEGPV